MMRSVWAYARVSTPKQRASLLSQQRLIENYCRESEVFLKARFSDIGSGKKLENLTGLQEISSRLGRNETIIVRDVSRLGRNITDVQRLIHKIHNKNSNVYSILDDVSSNNLDFMKWVQFAEIELQIHLSRQARQLEYLKSQGAHLGRPPKGYHIIRVNGIPQLAKD